MSELILSTSRLSKSVSNENLQLSILRDVVFDLPRHTSVAIVGASGSGKSTLLGLLAGLDLPTKGVVKIMGVALNELSENERARLRASNLSFVFQSFYLLDELTALENVALPLELFKKRDALSTAGAWLKKLGLSERIHHYPKQLSGGEQQRVALCRAFAVKPAILFADEPTANLDESTAGVVVDHLFDLHREVENSMVIATHDWSIANRCDKIYELKSGQLHEYA